MNVYTAEFIAANEVKDEVFTNKAERDALARSLRHDGWKVIVATHTLSGVYALHAKRAR